MTVGHAIVELVGGPLCGMLVPLTTIDAPTLARRIDEELATDPLAGTRFGCPPPVLEERLLILANPKNQMQAFYAFGIPWMTEDRYRLRAEYVPMDAIDFDGEEDDGDMGGAVLA